MSFQLYFRHFQQFSAKLQPENSRKHFFVIFISRKCRTLQNLPKTETYGIRPKFTKSSNASQFQLDCEPMLPSVSSSGLWLIGLQWNNNKPYEFNWFYDLLSIIYLDGGHHWVVFISGNMCQIYASNVIYMLLTPISQAVG